MYNSPFYVFGNILTIKWHKLSFIMAMFPPESFRAFIGKAALFVRPLATLRDV